MERRRRRVEIKAHTWEREENEEEEKEEDDDRNYWGLYLPRDITTLQIRQVFPFQDSVVFCRLFYFSLLIFSHLATYRHISSCVSPAAQPDLH